MIKRYLLCVSLVFTFYFLDAQTSVPYRTSFDSTADTVGWKTYSITGVNSWQWGVPGGFMLNQPHSQPFAWTTYQQFPVASNAALESPWFDLTDTTRQWVVGFYNGLDAISSRDSVLFEVRTGQNDAWRSYTPLLRNKNWQGGRGFSGQQLTPHESSILLDSLAGEDSVAFRFRNRYSAGRNEGWLIDDFSIRERSFNLKAISGDSVRVDQTCPVFMTTIQYVFDHPYDTIPFTTVNYHFSQDSILDSQDTLINTWSGPISNLVWGTQLTLPQGIPAGNYYLLFSLDVNDTLPESDELDNTGYIFLRIDSVYSLPFVDDLEQALPEWTFGDYRFEGIPPVWERGAGYTHRLEGTHSGQHAWHTSKAIYYNRQRCNSGSCAQVLEFPAVDMTSDTMSPVVNFWYKNEAGSRAYDLNVKKDCQTFWNYLATVPTCRNDDWDFYNADLSGLTQHHTLSIQLYAPLMYPAYEEGIMIDDIYIGRAKADLSISGNLENYFSDQGQSADTLHYRLVNSGTVNASTSTTSFYWSTDSVLDLNDTWIGSSQEASMAGETLNWRSFSFTKPSTQTGVYYIFYSLDSAQTIDEMREYDNVGFFVYRQQPALSLPYFDDFESGEGWWRHAASLGSDEWELAIPAGSMLDTAFSGQYAWVTQDTGYVQDLSRMHLYSPVFDFSSMQNPVLSMDMKLVGELDGRMNMSYSIDGGTTWNVLDTTSESYYRWYNRIRFDIASGKDEFQGKQRYEYLDALSEPVFITSLEYYGRFAPDVTTYTLDLDFLSGETEVQFRFNLGSQQVGFKDFHHNSYKTEGSLIDNFSIQEGSANLEVDYSKAMMISSEARQAPFRIKVRNSGMSGCEKSLVHCYLSADSALDASDFSLGYMELPGIQPSSYEETGSMFTLPANLSSYRWFVYVLDDSSWVAESDELDNTGFWPLALDSIHQYPYLNTFEDSVVHGWESFASYGFGLDFSIHRFRNIRAHNESFLLRPTGAWFTEPVATTGFANSPTFTLQSPVFDFSGYDSLHLSFDLYCSGALLLSTGRAEGGSLYYSTDGGNQFQALEARGNESHNWFDVPSLFTLGGSPGWANYSQTRGEVNLDSTALDFSFLRGEEQVVFQYLFSSKFNSFNSPHEHGMRIDNFRIQTWGLDLEASGGDSSLMVNLSSPDFSLDYDIDNTGDVDARASISRFYWSTDSVWDANDSLFYVENVPLIPNSQSQSQRALIPYPLPVIQKVYYLFTHIDGNNTIEETDENNNIHRTKITFDRISGVEPQSQSFIYIFTKERTLYILGSEDASWHGPATVNVYDNQGKRVFSRTVFIQAGMNHEMQFPASLVQGQYNCEIQGRQGKVSKKLLLRQ